MSWHLKMLHGSSSSQAALEALPVSPFHVLLLLRGNPKPFNSFQTPHIAKGSAVLPGLLLLLLLVAGVVQVLLMTTAAAPADAEGVHTNYLLVRVSTQFQAGIFPPLLRYFAAAAAVAAATSC
jgi:hypothetical protein